MMRNVLATAAGSAVLVSGMSLATDVEAQTLGAQWDVTVGVERVFGFYSIDVERHVTDTQVQRRDQSNSGVGYQPSIGFFDLPRVGVDVFIVERLSLGGSIGFFSIDTDDDDDVSGLIFAPRVGYVIPFDQRWGFWPRGGLSYVSREFDNDQHLTALTLEAQFYFMPSPFVGFTAGLLADLGITGEWGPQNRDYDERLLGLGFGMFARF